MFRHWSNAAFNWAHRDDSHRKIAARMPRTGDARSGAGIRPRRILTILARFGTEQYPTAEPDIDEIFRRQMSSVERTVVVVDNALPAGLIEERGPRVLIGGNNDAGEFSAFDRAVQFIGSDIWRYDFVHFATSAFNTLYVSYLDRFNPSLLEAVTSRPVCVGHIDCYNEAVEILGFRTQHWIRSCFFFLPPSEVRALGSFVTIRRGDGVFSGQPISRRYQQYIIEWLTGRDIGQGVKWHSSLTPAGDTLPAFEHKAMAIMNEQLLGVRLRAMGCRLMDVTWLATELRRTGGAPAVTDWREQLASRDRDALVLSIDGTDSPVRLNSTRSPV